MHRAGPPATQHRLPQAAPPFPSLPMRRAGPDDNETMYPIHFPGKVMPGAVRASLLALFITGTAHAAEPDGAGAPLWKLSGFGTLGAVHSS